MNGWEIRECADQMLAQFGEDAQIEVAMRVEAMQKADDRAGHWVWARILIRLSFLGPLGDINGTMH